MEEQFLIEETDRRANRYSLRCFCIMMAALSAAWIFNQLDIFIVEKQTMNTCFLTALVLFGVCMVICGILGISSRKMKYVLLFFIIAITTVIGTMLTYHSVLLLALPIVYSSMYHDAKHVTLYTYTLTVVSIFVSVFGGYCIGLCDANMALLTSMPLAEYVGADGLFTLNQINPNPVLTLLLYFVFPRSVICGVFALVCNNISEIIAESRIKEHEMCIQAEIDGMTGVYNRRKYLELASDEHILNHRLAVVFWDVNDLKKINDSYGHEYGDRLIITISESIKQIASPTDEIIRIGGDEFLMIFHGGDERMVEEKLSKWEDIIRGRDVVDGISATASYGYACGFGSQLEELVHQADLMMYKNKRAFHEKQQ